MNEQQTVVSTSPSKLNVSNASCTTPISTPEKGWTGSKTKGGAKPSTYKVPPSNLFETVAASTTSSVLKTRPQAKTEETYKQLLPTFEETSIKNRNSRKRTLSNLSSSSSSSDSDEEQNNDGDDQDNDDTSSSDSCSSTSSSGSDSSESSSDSSDCDDNDDDNDDDDYDSENSESKSNIMLAQIYKKQKCEGVLSAGPKGKHLNVLQPQKEEEWGFAAVAKSNPDIFGSGNSGNNGKNTADIVKNIKSVKRKITEHFTMMSKEQEQQHQIQLEKQTLSQKLANQNQTPFNQQNIVLQNEKKIGAIKTTDKSSTATQATVQKPTILIKYKPKHTSDNILNKKAEDAVGQKKAILLKSMPLEKKPVHKVRAEEEEEEEEDDDDVIPYLSQKNVIKYKMMEDIDKAKNVEKPEELVKETEEKHPWEITVDENPFDSQPLPNGVSQTDYDIYKVIRERARKTITGAMESPRKLISKPSFTNSNTERCPGSIEIGKWHIETWYSSPFPQEYARYTKICDNRFLIINCDFISDWLSCICVSFA